MLTTNKTKKKLDWSNLKFSYIQTDYRFVANFNNGVWSEGELIKDPICHIPEGAQTIHYAQQCFEGLKAQTDSKGNVLLFRPELNAERFQETAKRLLMPPVPKKLFLNGIFKTIQANFSWIPPYGTGASLYIRPVLFSIDKNLGLNSAMNYEFRIFVSPVGPYYKGDGLSLISLAVTNIDRAAPKGTGRYKAGANYAGGLLATQIAKKMGADEALYLDAKTETFLEEAGSANIVLVMKDNSLVTPLSDTILPSITRKSVMVIGKEELNLKTEERPIPFLKEVNQIEEVGACGTAAVISPVGKILLNKKWYHFYKHGTEVGPTIQKLYHLLTQIQKGEREDPYNWTLKVEV